MIGDPRIAKSVDGRTGRLHAIMFYKGQLIWDTRQKWFMGHGITSTTTSNIMGQAYSLQGHLGLKLIRYYILSMFS